MDTGRKRIVDGVIVSHLSFYPFSWWWRKIWKRQRHPTCLFISPWRKLEGSGESSIRIWGTLWKVEQFLAWNCWKLAHYRANTNEDKYLVTPRRGKQKFLDPLVLRIWRWTGSSIRLLGIVIYPREYMGHSLEWGQSDIGASFSWVSLPWG